MCWTCVIKGTIRQPLGGLGMSVEIRARGENDNVNINRTESHEI